MSGAGARECLNAVRLLKVSPVLLTKFSKLLQKSLWKGQDGGLVMRQHVLTRDIDRLVETLEPFQEDPQLLDQHLRTILPGLAKVLAESVVSGTHSVPDGYSSARNAVCRILYSLCKIRGQKLIVQFLPNEPVHLEPLLTVFEAYGWVSLTGPTKAVLAWQESFVLMLWLSHLMLTPFDLSTISSDDPTITIRDVDFDLPPSLSLIVRRIFPLAFSHLKSPGKDQGAAAEVLARLCLRPDMRKAGLLKSVIEWTLRFLQDPPTDNVGIHHSIGVLTVLKVLAASSTVDEIEPYVFGIFDRCREIMQQTDTGTLGNSASALRRCVKIVRHLAIHCIRSGHSLDADKSTDLVETAVELLLNTLSCGDSVIRFAASKALSHVTLALAPDVASEVIDAVVVSYQENIFDDGRSTNTAAVDPSRWHGLTLTLAHLLYRRAPPPSKLAEILNALLLALGFEQRSAIGTSIGTNVRDAACFGIWSVSRRYRTSELLDLDPSTIHPPSWNGDITGLSVLQILARELVTVACLDPVGNIRRGASAALQELIGRHPDTIIGAISLVQTVDFHAVGLHERAAVKISCAAGALDESYRSCLTSGLVGWRGVFSNDEKNRATSALAFSGLLSCRRRDGTSEDGDESHFDETATMLNLIAARLTGLKARQVEERHGLMLAAAQLIEDHSPAFFESRATLPWLLTYASLLDSLQLQPGDFTSKVLRPHLTCLAVLAMVKSLSSVLSQIKERDQYEGLISTLLRLFNYVLLQNDPAVLSSIPGAARSLGECLPVSDLRRQADEWLTEIEKVSGMSRTPYYLVLGSVVTLLLWEGPDIIAHLSQASVKSSSIEARVVALQALSFSLPRIFEAGSDRRQIEYQRAILSSIHQNLIDYTVSDRGDVGSLVRFEALGLLRHIWTSDAELIKSLDMPLPNKHYQEDAHHRFMLSVIGAAVQISLERIDKGRMLANDCLVAAGDPSSFRFAREIGSIYKTIDEKVAGSKVPAPLTVQYYSTIVGTLFSPEFNEYIHWSVMKGIAGAASQGSEDLIRTSRAGLADALGPDDRFVETTTGTGKRYDRRRWFFARLVECIKNAEAKTGHKIDGIDRLIRPLFDLLAFVLEMGLHPPLLPEPKPDYQPRDKIDDNNEIVPSPNIPSMVGLTKITHDFHFRTQNVQKLYTAIDVYRALAMAWPRSSADPVVPVGNPIVTAHYRLASLLLHRFPRVRVAASRALWVVGQAVDPASSVSVAGLDITDSKGGGVVDSGAQSTRKQVEERKRVRAVLFLTDWISRLDAPAATGDVVKGRPEVDDLPTLTVREAAKIVIAAGGVV